MDITTLPIDMLLDDLQDFAVDIRDCKVAAAQGVINYSGGTIDSRIEGNEHCIRVIREELKRRAE